MTKYILLLSLFAHPGDGPNAIPDSVHMSSYAVYQELGNCQNHAERLVRYYGRHIQDVQCVPFSKQALRRNY